MSQPGCSTAQVRERMSPNAGDGGRVSEQQARERLVEAARIAFGTNGFHATTTRLIAAEAGMSPAAVYVHHQSKEDLLFQLSLQGHRNTLNEIRDSIAGAGTATEQLRDLVRAFARREAVHHTTARILNYDLAALSSDHRREIDGLRRQIHDTVLEVLASGVQTGEFDCAEPSLTAVAVMGMCIDVARWYRDEGDWSAEKVADHHAQMAVRMVTGRGAGR